MYLSIQCGRQYSFGLLQRLGMMVGAQGQEAVHASTSHQQSRLLQGHLHRHLEWAHWKLGRGEGDKGEKGTGGCVKEERKLDESLVTKRC